MLIVQILCKKLYRFIDHARNAFCCWTSSSCSSSSSSSSIHEVQSVLLPWVCSQPQKTAYATIMVFHWCQREKKVQGKSFYIHLYGYQGSWSAGPVVKGVLTSWNYKKGGRRWERWRWEKKKEEETEITALSISWHNYVLGFSLLCKCYHTQYLQMLCDHILLSLDKQ